MKKIISLTLAILMLVSMLAGCGSSAGSKEITVGICQLMVHESLDKATQGFIDALTAQAEAAGKTVKFDTQVAGDAALCTTVINTFTAKKVDFVVDKGAYDSIIVTINDFNGGKAVVIINPSASATLNCTLDGAYHMISNGSVAGTTSLGEFSGKISVPACSVVIFVTENLLPTE